MLRFRHFSLGRLSVTLAKLINISLAWVLNGVFWFPGQLFASKDPSIKYLFNEDKLSIFTIMQEPSLIFCNTSLCSTIHHHSFVVSPRACWNALICSRVTLALNSYISFFSCFLFFFFLTQCWLYFKVTDWKSFKFSQFSDRLQSQQHW